MLGPFIDGYRAQCGRGTCHPSEIMAHDLQRIQRAVAALIRRERVLIVGQVLLQAVLLLAVVLVVASLAAAGGWDRPASALLLVLLAGVGSWVAVFVPLLLRWRAASDPLRQARKVEALEPGLRGRLITAVGRIDGPVRGESEQLLGLVARKAAALADAVPRSRVHPATGVARLAFIATVAWGLVLPFTLLVPGGPRGVAEFWLRGVADVVTSTAAITHDEPRARVGDLVLRYTYPGYTGLEPRVVTNSTGDMSGPPGTVVEVTARAAEVVEAAGIVAYEQRLEAALGDEGREITGRVAIQAESSTYHLVLYRGGEPERSPDFAIEVEEDLAPEVMLDAESDQLEVALDQHIQLPWRARDDFGVSRVSLMVNGQVREPSLFRAQARRAEMADLLVLSPADLGLAPGDTADLVVAAWDNDSYSGAKAGYSRTIRVTVLGARGLQERDTARREALKRILVPILARFLTEAFPPGDQAGDLARWGDVVLERYAPLYDAVDDLWGGTTPDSYDADVVRSVVDSGRKLVRYVQVSFPTTEGDADPDAVEVTRALRDTAIVDIERALLAFLGMEEAEALARVLEATRDLEAVANQLEEALSRDEPDVQELLARLDQLEMMLQQLAETAARLQEGGLKEFLNQRSSELDSLMDEIREAIARGDLDEARELMERLARMLQELSEGVQNDMQQRQQQGDEVGKKAEAFQERLEELEKRQRDLQEEVHDLRSTDDAQGAERVEALWAEVERLAAEVVEEGRGYVDGIREARRRIYEVETARAAVEASESLRSAAEARDLRGARSAAVDARGMWINVGRSAAIRPHPPDEPGLLEVEEVNRKLERIEALLDQLDQESDRLDPQVQERARQLEQQQRDLQNELRQAQQEGRELMEQFPVRPEGMGESLQQAGERMGEASEDLRGGRPMQAEGSQGVAAEHLREARESMERAMDQARRQQQQMMQQGRQRQPGDEDDGQQNNQPNPWPRMEIPGREEFRTPEEYRRALLEGMEAEVPDEFRALKKRYYEELVHQ